MANGISTLKSDVLTPLSLYLHFYLFAFE